MKILFITYMFPPYSAIGSIRTGKTAKYLFEFGHDVNVVSCANQSLKNNLPLEIPEHHVQYTAWINVNSPIELILGGKKRVARLGFLESAGHLPSLIREKGYLYRNLFNFPDGHIGWFPFAKQAGHQKIQEWKPDLIFASASPFTSLLVASSLSRKYNIPWIAELRDLWTDNHMQVRPSWRQFFEKPLERRVLSSACGLVTVSDPMKKILESKYSSPCVVITNGFDPDDRPEEPDITFSSDTVNIIYTGQIYAAEQDPSPLFKALHLMGKEREDVRVYFFGRNLSGMNPYAVEHGVNHLVEIHKSLSHRQSLSIQNQSDILLLLNGQSAALVGPGGKIFEYLGARRPILCIGNTEGVAADLIGKRCAGTTLNDPEKIANQLKYWIQQKKNNGNIPFLPAEVGKGFTRKEQTEKLVNFFKSCLKNPVSA